MTGPGARRFPRDTQRTDAPSVIISHPVSESERRTVEKCSGSAPVSSTSPPAAAQAARYVAETMRSGIILCLTSCGEPMPPRTLTVGPPAPLTPAPSWFRKPCSSAISGSRAAFMITVSPSARQAQSMAFSVAPTLGMGRAMAAPRSLSGTEQDMSPPLSSMRAPRALRAPRWRSMGLGPSSQPPGMLSRAAPQRASRAPRKITELLSSRMSSCGISAPVMYRESIVTSCPERSTAQPMRRSILTVASTSRSSGTFVSRVTPGNSTLAAIIGSTAFFAPCTATRPRRGLPPDMCQTLINSPPDSRITPSYAGEAALVIPRRGSGRGPL